MDLKFSTAQATDEERAAIDAVLGAPGSGWEGGDRLPERDGHVGHGGAHLAADRRHHLLPALHGAQNRAGWISPGALDYICRRLSIPPAEAYGVATFYHLFAVEPRARSVAYVCDDIACRATGAFDDLVAGLEAELGPEGEGSDATWLRSPCLGRCGEGPAVFFQVAGARPVRFDWAPMQVEHALTILQGAGGTVPLTARAYPAPQTNPDRREPGLRLLRRVGTVDPDSLISYRDYGGFTALGRAIDMGAEAVVDEIVASKLMGRGGAAFPAGVKWRAVAGAEGPRYLICNADESEPGTFKDRVLMENDPFALIEAMTIAGFAVGAEQGYLYIRGEYPRAEQRLESAIAQAREQRLLGHDILHQGITFDIEIRRGAGAYICGEETALFNSIEGYRGEPRQKPPFPTEAGLFGRPTVVNNVETLFNVLDIVLEGGEAFASIGTEGSTGTKLFCLSGAVGQPGVYEFPFGVTLREVLDAAHWAPSVTPAVLVGGAAGSFVGPDQYDTPLTFEGAREAGIALGSGVVMPFTSDTDFAAITRRIAEFFRDESCGQCVPCRVGTARQEEVLARLGGREDRRTEIALIDDIARAMRDASICGLGQAAPNQKAPTRRCSGGRAQQPSEREKPVDSDQLVSATGCGFETFSTETLEIGRHSVAP